MALSKIKTLISKDWQITNNEWAGAAGYAGITYTLAGNTRFGFSAAAGACDVYTDGSFIALDSLKTSDTGSVYSRSFYGPDLNRALVGAGPSWNGYGLWFDTDASTSYGTNYFGGVGDTNRIGFVGGNTARWWLSLNDGLEYHSGAQYMNIWKAYLDRAWDSYPSITVENDTRHGPQGEFRIHGLPGYSGGDYSIATRSDGGFISGSDLRRKTGIDSINDALSRITSLEGKVFHTINKDGLIEEGMSASGKKFGLIAQQAIDFIPEAVKYYPEVDTPLENGWASAYSIDYASIVALLIEGIKEQQVQIESLKTENAQQADSIKRILNHLNLAEA